MADLIRRVTIGKGHDPRDFVLFAFGGAGPVHAGVFARELGVQKVIIPQRETASTWCAFGAASADILHIHERVDIVVSPFDRPRIAQTIAQLEARARHGMTSDGIAPDRQRFQLSLDMRHQGQINEVEVTVDWDWEADIGFELLAARFYRRYEQLYGRGSSFKGARLEIVTYRVRAMADTPRPTLRTVSGHGDDGVPLRRATRGIYWDELKQVVETAIYDGARLLPDQPVTGPAVVETPDTSVVVRPGQTLVLDRFGNFELTVGASSESAAGAAMEMAL